MYTKCKSTIYDLQNITATVCVAKPRGSERCSGAAHDAPVSFAVASPRKIGTSFASAVPFSLKTTAEDVFNINANGVNTTK